jgi:hypothetical protein
VPRARGPQIRSSEFGVRNGKGARLGASAHNSHAKPRRREKAHRSAQFHLINGNSTYWRRGEPPNAKFAPSWRSQLRSAEWRFGASLGIDEAMPSIPEMGRRRWLIFRGLSGLFTCFSRFFTPFFSRKRLIFRELSKIPVHRRHTIADFGVRISDF